jgi:hypothetical protein
MLTITEEMRESARKLLTAKVNPRDHYGYDTLLHKHDRDLLTAIANGKRKLIDGQWWKEMHRVVAKDKLDKLSRLADPDRNDNPHERDLASAKLAEFKARRPPGMPPEGRPLPKTWEEWEEAKRKATEARKRARSKAEPKTEAVKHHPISPLRFAVVKHHPGRAQQTHAC